MRDPILPETYYWLFEKTLLFWTRITHTFQYFTKPPPLLNIPQIPPLYPEIGSIQHFQRSAGNPSLPLEQEAKFDNTQGNGFFRGNRFLVIGINKFPITT
jgi:hypothetical protein